MERVLKALSQAGQKRSRRAAREKSMSGGVLEEVRWSESVQSGIKSRAVERYYLKRLPSAG